MSDEPHAMEPVDSTSAREAHPPEPAIGTPPVPTVIRSTNGWDGLRLGELWEARELVCFLTWRSVKVRYKQTLLGVAWAVLQPTLMMLVFSVFLGGIAGIASGDLPYPVFVFAGLLPWTFFATAVTNAANSVVESERLVTKVYFPRLALPFAAVAAAMVDFAIAFGVLIVLMAYYGIAPGLQVVFLPGLLLLVVLAALGIGTLLAALNVAYRDFRYVVGFMMQLWMLATPSIYMESAATDSAAARPSSVAGDNVDNQTPSPTVDSTAEPAAPRPSWVRRLARLNPMTEVIAGCRNAMLGRRLQWKEILTSSLGILCVLWIGCFGFRRIEDTFADTI